MPLHSAPVNAVNAPLLLNRLLFLHSDPSFSHTRLIVNEGTSLPYLFITYTLYIKSCHD